MDPRKLSSNKELFDYLVWLGGLLNSMNQIEISKEILCASRFFVGSPSEFFHETLQALNKAKDTVSSVLTKEQLEDMMAVIAQINKAFKDIGGA